MDLKITDKKIIIENGIQILDEIKNKNPEFGTRIQNLLQIIIEFWE